VVSAGNIVRTLALTASDVNLNIMPLFHIHGLMAGLLAPLLAGGTVFATPGFNALKFFAWVERAKPTWYTAVPTMHQAILARAERHHDVIGRHPLRFIRSSSSSMPPQVIAAIRYLPAAASLEASADRPVLTLRLSMRPECRSRRETSARSPFAAPT
jgi:acyl-CoA synthetase (AMP-forming)/AMP-acid ligase II